MTFTYLIPTVLEGFQSQIDDKFKEVKDFQQFRAKAGAGAGARTEGGAVVFKSSGFAT